MGRLVLEAKVLDPDALDHGAECGATLRKNDKARQGGPPVIGALGG